MEYNELCLTGKISLRTRIGWGFGGLSIGFMTNALNVLFLILYADYLKMPPVLAGLALALPRLIDSVADPLETNDLRGNPEDRAVLDRLRAKLEEYRTVLQ